MTPKSTAPKNIDEYIARYPTEVQVVLEKIRVTIKKAAPAAEETISYQIPAFTLKGNLIYFAAFKKHIGLFPPTTGDEKFNKAIAIYQGPKGNLRFPLDQRIPYAIISKIIKIRVKENLARAKAKGKLRT